MFRKRLHLGAAVLLIVLLFAAALPAAAVPDTGYFYILQPPENPQCVDAGGGLVEVRVDRIRAVTYHPINNLFIVDSTNWRPPSIIAFAFGPSLGTPGAGFPVIFRNDARSFPGSAPVSLQITVNMFADDVAIGSSSLRITCTGAGAAPIIEMSDTYASPGFSNPPLPLERNLVLITGDYGVYSEPNGAATGAVVRRCQTAFAVETSADGEWYRLYQLGGWIPVITTRDVAENYGQPGGEPIDPSCQ